MTKLEKIRQVSHLLLCTDDAFRTYQQTAMKGQAERDWASWYAEYLIGHGLDNVLEDSLPVDQLEEYLRRASDLVDPDIPSGLWAASAAPVLLDLATQ